MHSHPEAADTLIVGAQLYDGTGAPPVERDVAVRDGRVLACSFHPELTDDLRVHALLMAMATAARGERAATPSAGGGGGPNR